MQKDYTKKFLSQGRFQARHDITVKKI